VVQLLQTLANTTSVAMEHIQVHEELERRVKMRTAELQAANEALEAFSSSVSHDLRNPLSAINGFAALAGRILPADGDPALREYIEGITGETRRMKQLIDDLLRLASLSRQELQRARVDLSALAADVVARLRSAAPERRVDVRIEPGLTAQGDPGLLGAVMENLISNAWKYTSRRDVAVIEVARESSREGEDVFSVRDNGAGFDMRFRDRLFTPFKRLHSASTFPGSGIGLATVRQIVERHGGRVEAEGVVDVGATFSFSLPRAVTT
jgi:signal transduction histidine kinase